MVDEWPCSQFVASAGSRGAASRVCEECGWHKDDHVTLDAYAEALRRGGHRP